MHIDCSILPLHRTAVQKSVDIVNAVSRDDLGRPTPCAGWTLGDLLTHMTVQHHGFAAAARGNGADSRVWDAATVADAVAANPAAAYADSAADVLEAFSADGILDAPFAIPEFQPGVDFPGSMAIAAHFVDYVVHGWDVARTLGAPFELPNEVTAAALPIAFAVPDGETRTSDDAPFGPAVASNGATSDLDRMLAHLGRSPAWSAPA
ncbi:TIGR03086 family metal-binding protein [Mycobacterium deserti]|uniref:TIGR03086 family metal-binding protein n=1 Tax=Mycobacterium deserti TaxID=2978347 RepID=A0ABT2M952_9MYCO|nr:TIGR03086 family metal-binding protein [Mycobacterium deserti]MCT7658149.1 TIGR03086 family metal-binding protein [Mycobacterium deserti]